MWSIGPKKRQKAKFFCCPQKAKFAHSKADEQKAKDSFFERHYTQSMNIKKVRHFDRLHNTIHHFSNLICCGGIPLDRYHFWRPFKNWIKMFLDPLSWKNEKGESSPLFNTPVAPPDLNYVHILSLTHNCSKLSNLMILGVSVGRWLWWVMLKHSMAKIENFFRN